MSKLPRLSGDEVIKILVKKIGFGVSRQRHVNFTFQNIFQPILMKLKELIEKLDLFERCPNNIRILGIAIYIQTSSTRRTAKILSEFHLVSHTAVWKWVEKFEEKLPISTEKKRRNLIAIDETVDNARR